MVVSAAHGSSSAKLKNACTYECVRQVMTVDQLQKPNVAAKLVTKFALTPPVSDRRASRVPATGRRGRLTAATLEPLGLAVTKADELVVANAGDDSVLLYDVEGRLIRRVDQRQLLQTRVHHDDESKDDDASSYAAAAAAAADKTDIKLVPFRVSTSL